MSSRFLLIPEAMYNGLLNSSRPEENINLAFVKKKLAGVKNAKHLNKSARNILYNQELRRLLKIHKDVEDKPVKVELTDGSSLIGRRGNNTSAIIGSDGEEEDIIYTPSVYTTASRSTKKDSSFHSVSESGEEDLTDDEVLEQAIERVSSQRARYGITPKGEILDSNRIVIPNSNFKSSIKSIVTPAGGSIPPGSEILRRRISTDPWLNGLAAIATPRPPLNLSETSSTNTSQKTPIRPKRQRRLPKFTPNAWGHR